MSLVTKGLGSNRIVSMGLGYLFSWPAYVASVSGGSNVGGAAPLWHPNSYVHRDYKPSYLARRPRRGKREPITLQGLGEFEELDLLEDAAWPDETEEPDAEDSQEDSQPVMKSRLLPRKTEVASTQEPAPPQELVSAQPSSSTQTPRKKSTGTKVAVAVGIGALCAAAVYLLRKNARSSDMSKKLRRSSKTRDLSGTMLDFMRSAQIKRKCEYGRNPFEDQFASGSTSYRCTLRLGRKRMVVPFTMGPAHRLPPTTQEILDALASDSSSYENARSYGDWLEEMGGGEDTKRMRQIYRAVGRSAARLRSFLGDDAYNQLVWHTDKL